MTAQKIYYQPQYNWTDKEYSSLFFVLNKAVLEEQEFLGKINLTIVYNSTKAILKGLIEYYGKEDVYEKFPNLQVLKNQQSLFVPVEIKSGLKISELDNLGIKSDV